MPASLKLLRENSFTDRDYNGPRTARVAAILSGFTPAVATNGDIFTANDQAASVAVALAGIGPGDAFPGTTSNYCACIGVRAQPTQGTNFIVLWDFDRPTGFTTGNGVTNTLYVTNERVGLTEVQRIKLPHINSGDPISLGWEDATNADNVINPQTAQMTIKKPTQQIILSGRFNQTPTYAGGSQKIGAKVGWVNDASWQGFEKGFWLFAGMVVDRQPASQIRNVQILLLNMQDQDWSEYVLIQHPSGMTVNYSAAQINALGAEVGGYPLSGDNYIKPASGSHATAGIVRIGPHQAMSFASLFASLDIS